MVFRQNDLSGRPVLTNGKRHKRAISFLLYKTYLKVFKVTTFNINIYFCNCIILLRHGFPEENVTFNSSCCGFIYTLLFKPIHNERIMISL